MLRKILGTVGTRYLIAFLNLFLIFINAKILGKEGLGLVGLIYASANIAVMFNSVLCGNTIVYFMNRYPLGYVFWPAAGWSFVGSAIACGIMFFLGMIPEGYGWLVYGLAVLMTLVGVNSRVFLGEDRIAAFNLTMAVQGGGLFVFLLFFYFVAGAKEVSSYVNALFLTNGTALLLSILLLASSFSHKSRKAGYPEPDSFGKILKEMFVYGLWSSMESLAEGLTTRLNYFMVERFSGLGGVGLLDSGTKVSESAWNISRGVSLIEYSSIAKTKDAEEQRRITLQLFKLTYCVLFLVMGIILLVPEWIYTKYLFSAEFKGIREIILLLSVGIVAFGGNNILAHYFIGCGKIKYCAACSFLGLGTLLLIGCFLIPAKGIPGAALTSSIAYICMLLFSLLVFMRQTRTAARELLPTPGDWEALRSRLFHKHSKH